MAAALFSPSWYRVAKLRPRLRSHVEIHRHSYRDQVWHVLQDHALGRLRVDNLDEVASTDDPVFRYVKRA